jgi:hypothetical protein
VHTPDVDSAGAVRVPDGGPSAAVSS